MSYKKGNAPRPLLCNLLCPICWDGFTGTAGVQVYCCYRCADVATMPRPIRDRFEREMRHHARTGSPQPSNGHDEE